MTDAPDYDAREAWDAIYSRSDVVPDQPNAKTRACVEALSALAAGGPALELAVGNGRVAIPLAATGIEVDGIDISPVAIDLIRAHPRGQTVTASVGDISDFSLGRTYSLVYLVFNTIMNLTTQDAQVACFESAARHLRPGGCFVIENMVPVLRRLPSGNSAVPFTVTENYIGLDEFTDLTHLQVSWSSHFTRRRDGTFRESRAPYRYVWPSELDLMARIAGMALDHRWAGWDRTPFTGDSASHVSVWRVPAG